MNIQSALHINTVALQQNPDDFAYNERGLSEIAKGLHYRSSIVDSISKYSQEEEKRRQFFFNKELTKTMKNNLEIDHYTNTKLHRRETLYDLLGALIDTHV